MRHHASSRAALRPALLLCPLLIAFNQAYGESLSGKDLITALRGGGYVILMRHASSPGTVPDPAQANADNVQHERQLDEEGRSSARAMGDALRQLQIPIRQVLSSPTYRALETIKFVHVGQPTTFAQLGDGGQSMVADKTGAHAAWLRAKSGEAPSRGTNTLIVTHFPNIRDAYPEHTAGLADGEALILRPSRDGAQIVARIKIEEWVQLSNLP
jgi:phosphohistidine phosphatase SixA